MVFKKGNVDSEFVCKALVRLIEQRYVPTEAAREQSYTPSATPENSTKSLKAHNGSVT